MRFSIQYYDLVLLGILFSLLGGAVVGYVTALPSAITVPAAALVGIALIYQAIFRGESAKTVAELSEEVREVELLE